MKINPEWQLEKLPKSHQIAVERYRKWYMVWIATQNLDDPTDEQIAMSAGLTAKKVQAIRWNKKYKIQAECWTKKRVSLWDERFGNYVTITRSIERLIPLAFMVVEQHLGHKDPSVAMAAAREVLDRSGQYDKKSTLKVEHSIPLAEIERAKQLVQGFKMLPPEPLPVLEGQVLKTEDADVS
jgi:hypothetical protein